MKFDKELTSKILTGLDNGTFEGEAEEPAEGDDDLQEWIDAIAGLVDRHGPDMVAALAQYVRDSREDVQAFELVDFAEEHHQASGHRVGEVLKEYAENSEIGDLYDLFAALDEAGATDWFDWEGYADSRMAPLNGLHFVVVPACGTGRSVFLFRD